MIATSNQHRRYAIVGVSVFVAVFLISQVVIGPPSTIQTVKDTTHHIFGSIQQPLSMADSVSGFFQAIKLPVTAPSYVDATGKAFNLTTKPHWTEPLGKDILIVDIDTRQPTGYNQIFNDTKMDWVKLGNGEYMDTNVGLISEAVMSHYLYAKIHGYDYMFYQAEELHDRYNTWVKVYALAELLRRKTHKFVVFLDADVTVHHFQVPLEWLMNKWNVSPETSLALPVDIERENCITCDTRGQAMLNTGFVIAQNLPHTDKIFDAWATCTDEGRYKGCGKWKHDWAHEQRAFSEYIRYDDELNPDENIRPIPCDDANGYPERNEVKDDDNMKFLTDCNGNFFQHHWLDGGKRIAKRSIGDSIMQSVTEAVQTSLWNSKDALTYNATKEAMQQKEKERIKTEEELELEMWEARQGEER